MRTTYRLRRVCYGVCLLLFSLQLTAQVRSIDLHTWGYQPPVDVIKEGFVQISPQIVAVAFNRDVYAGFVTHDSSGLSTRQTPGLSFHVIRFTKDGAFLSQKVFPTSS
jgi:hypothetical protein